MAEEKAGQKVEAPTLIGTEPTTQVLAQDTTKEAEQLRNQVKELETKVLAAQQEAKAHQRVASEKERKIQELARQKGGGGKELRAEVADLMERLGSEQGLNDPTLLAKAQSIREATKREELMAYAEQRREQVRGEIEQTIRDANLDPKDEAFDPIWDRLKLDYYTDGEGGEFTTAKERAKRIVNKMKPTETKPEIKTKTTEEEHEEWLRAKMEKEGKLVTDTSLPSGASGSWLEFEQKFIRGEVSAEDYAKRARAEGKNI